MDMNIGGELASKFGEELASVIVESISQRHKKGDDNKMHLLDVLKALVKYADKKEWLEYEYGGVKHATYTSDIRLTLKQVGDNIEVYYYGNLIYCMDILKYVILVDKYKEKKFRLFKRKKKVKNLNSKQEGQGEQNVQNS